MTIRFFGTLFLVVVALAAQAARDPVVTVPADAPAAVRIAAEEFQKYWGEITGRRIDVTVQRVDRGPASSGASRVRIGFPSQDPLFAGETDADEADAALARYTSDLDFVILAYGLAVWRDRRGATARVNGTRRLVLRVSLEYLAGPPI